ncbi:MAG: transcriptional regulator [Phycisphaerales bacterium]|nr:transcriptional regulator [Phycisphaerales bacterium]
MRPPQDADSRARILFFLKTRGPHTAAQLARRLGITPMGVRQHLARLEAEKAVTWEDVREGVGRPRRHWSVADAPEAREHFPDAHADLSLHIIDAARQAFGERGFDRLFEARTARQLHDYTAALPGPDEDLDRRIAALAKIRRDEGYMAEWTRNPDGSFMLLENHCPICAAARHCQGLCRAELNLFRAVLGDDVEIERVEHIIHGARRCAYRITPTA